MAERQCLSIPASKIVNCLVQRVARVATHPFKGDGSTLEFVVDPLEKSTVTDGLTICFPPPLPLPPGHPGRQRIDDILRIRDDMQRVLVGLASLLQEREDGHKLRLVVRCMGPTTR